MKKSTYMDRAMRSADPRFADILGRLGYERTDMMAEKAAEAGVDGIIAVCAGAGGHAGTASPFALIDEIQSFYEGAVILAGAINEGRDIAAAEALGADFAYMGTRFIAVQESLATADYKEMITNSGIDDVIYTDGVSGVNANFLLPSIQKAGIDLTQKKEEDFSELSGDNAKAWKDIWSAGHGVAGIDAVPTVSELANHLKKDYKATLQKQAAKLHYLRF